MKITSKSDYAMIIMIELAKNTNKNVVSLGSIAEKYNLSLSYIEQLATSLRRAKLIRSMQGVNGGYLLAKKPEKISSKEIIEAVGDEIYSVKCNDRTGTCPKRKVCNAKNSWNSLNDLVSKTFRSVSLAELVYEK